MVFWHCYGITRHVDGVVCLDWPVAGIPLRQCQGQTNRAKLRVQLWRYLSDVVSTTHCGIFVVVVILVSCYGYYEMLNDYEFYLDDKLYNPFIQFKYL